MRMVTSSSGPDWVWGRMEMLWCRSRSSLGAAEPHLAKEGAKGRAKRPHSASAAACWFSSPASLEMGLLSRLATVTCNTYIPAHLHSHMFRVALKLTLDLIRFVFCFIFILCYFQTFCPLPTVLNIIINNNNNNFYTNFLARSKSHFLHIGPVCGANASPSTITEVPTTSASPRSST